MTTFGARDFDVDGSAGKLIPGFEPAGLGLFESCLPQECGYLEYGCGGSTVFAAQRGVRVIYSVDTDRQWIDRVIEEVGTASLTRLHMTHCNLGPVEAWGKPASLDRIYDFHRYAFAPWSAVRSCCDTVDVVLIDGRFRVACFLVSLAFARVGTTILFDDYTDRDYYHVVERFCPVAESHGRMAKFIVGRPYDAPELLEAVAKYSIIRK